MIKVSIRTVKVLADYSLHIIKASDNIGKLHNNWFYVIGKLHRYYRIKLALQADICLQFGSDFVSMIAWEVT